MNKFGRKLSLTCSLLICGVTCIAGGFVPEKVYWVQTVMFLVGKMAITSSFSVVYVYSGSWDLNFSKPQLNLFLSVSAEMLPTLIRSGGVGVFSTFSRLGALLAPFVPLLKQLHSFLPLLVYGSFAFTSGLLALTLPETLGQKLPDTIEEAENIGKKSKTKVLF